MDYFVITNVMTKQLIACLDMQRENDEQITTYTINDDNSCSRQDFELIAN